MHAGTLIGRDAELARFGAELDALTAPPPSRPARAGPDALAAPPARAVLVAGEPGIGKSRLLAEVAARADARGMLVLTGSASEYERDLPFWLFVDALDEYLRAAAPDGLADADLAEVLPSVPAGDRPPALGDPRYRTHRAMRRLLETLAAKGPVVLVLDDLHWADSGSAELICALLRRPPAGPVLLAMAARPRQTPARLAAGLTGVTRLDLGPLSLDGARELIGDRAAAVYAESGGNPFYLRQLARSPRTTGNRDGGGEGDHEVPAAVAAAIADELALLDRVTRRVLEGAAVAGDPFLLELAAAAVPAGEREVAEAIDELESRDLIRPGEAPRRFRFRHPLLRRAVYDAAPRAWRVGAHERVAGALRERGVPPAGRAHHLVHAARRGDREAVAVLRAAGDDVVGRAPAEAAAWYEAAIALLTEDDADLWEARGRALGAAGRLTEARSALVRALDLRPGDPSLIAACAGLEHTLGHHDEASRRLETAFLEKGDARFLGALAQDHLFRLDYEGALEWSRRAHTEATPPRSSPPAVPSAEAAVGLAVSAAFAGSRSGGAACAEASALVDALTDEQIGCAPDPMPARLAAAELFAGRLAEAERHAERALALSGHHVPVMFWAGLVRAALGRLPEAESLLDEAIEVARATGNPSMLGWVLLARSTVATTCGDFTLARTAAEESVTLHTGMTLPAVWARAALAAALLESGEPGPAEQALPAEAHLPAPLRPGVNELRTRCLLQLGRPTGAATPLALAEVALHEGRHHTAAELALSAATVDAATVDAATVDAAPADGGRAIGPVDGGRAVAAAHRVLDGAAARRLAARALEAAGDRSHAREQLLLARAVYDRCGAPRRVAEIERDLRRLGDRSIHHRTARGAPELDGLASLTARELQIARLVTDRRTNAEIAAELYLSRKTVETHIRNLFHKLSVSSRQDIARLVERS
ncbi:ATP-binding protein [Actinoplanes sp. CA-131856]